MARATFGATGAHHSIRLRAARLIALALLGCAALFWMWVTLRGGGPPGGDIDRMWLGAERIRAGQPLYTNIGDERLFYTWSPWLAWLWLPLTYLPKAPVAVVWFVLCLIGWAATLWPARGSLALLLLVGPLTFFGAWSGNVQPIMTAALVFGIGRRWGPLAVGAAASLKVSPILFVLPWLSSREPKKVAIAVATALALGLPAFLAGIEHYPFSLPPLLSLRSVSAALWIAATVAAAGTALLPWTTRFRWLSSGVAVMLSRPSLLLYDVGYLFVGLDSRASRRSGAAPAQEAASEQHKQAMTNQ